MNTTEEKIAYALLELLQQHEAFAEGDLSAARFEATAKEMKRVADINHVHYNSFGSPSYRNNDTLQRIAQARLAALAFHVTAAALRGDQDELDSLLRQAAWMGHPENYLNVGDDDTWLLEDEDDAPTA